VSFKESKMECLEHSICVHKWQTVYGYLARDHDVSECSALLYQLLRAVVSFLAFIHSFIH
jgi:hypothetical protein